MTNIDLNKYSNFVEQVTSKPSNNWYDFIESINSLQNSGVKVPLLMTGAMGLCSEAGEFQEIVKKVVFQGKPFDEDVKYHALRELGDIIWYWVNACRALGVDPNDVIKENIHKLEARYPGGKFDDYYSENRKPNDL